MSIILRKFELEFNGSLYFYDTDKFIWYAGVNGSPLYPRDVPEEVKGMREALLTYTNQRIGKHHE